ncbi:MAG: hypothetical protein RL490_362 [Pseudomonadota bacterium]
MKDLQFNRRTVLLAAATAAVSEDTVHATEPPKIKHEGHWFRDLDHDGRVSSYEDWRLPVDVRAQDLLSRMTMAEKAGLMMHGTLPATGPFGMLGYGPDYDLAAAERLILGASVTSAITRLAVPPAVFAAQHNALQAIAARGRLGIPLTISTDPRHHFRTMAGASEAGAGFSQWPETLGLAAIDDIDLIRRFGDIVRTEYRAVGLHMALSPQADLATSPMWPRIDGTFGEDPVRVRRMVGAFVEGLQGGRSGLAVGGVAAVVKHWVGYGASEDGFDGHNFYGRYSAFPGGAFDVHVDAFRDALAFKVASVMPTYNILRDAKVRGQPVEPVGAGFSRRLLTELLRETCGFEGVVLSDWAITKDCNAACRTGQPPQTPADIAMSWGVEDLPATERFALGVNAGLDQFGGENDPEPLLRAIAEGQITAERIDQSVLRILKQKLALGLFEQPFVDADKAASIVGSQPFREAGQQAQRRSLVVLKGKPGAVLRQDDKVFVHGMAPAALADAGFATTPEPALATVALFRISAPFQRLHPTFFFGSRQHEGDLDFKADHPDLLALRQLPPGLRTVIIVHLDRPAVLAEFASRADSMVIEFGAGDDAVIDVLTGKAACAGVLPFNLPRSMAAVRQRRWDVPNDDPAPLFPINFRVR